MIKLPQLLLATSNVGKIAEFQALFSQFTCIGQDTLGIIPAAETAPTFVENALLKARHASAASQKAALADDSGLVVPALNGQPGIYSARYAGPKATDEQNIALLLENLRGCTQRQAYFYCALVYVRHTADPTPLIATGQCYGEIIDTPIGNHGFGYDPVFYVPEYQCTFAELAPSLKNRISHRAQALHIMLDKLAQHS